MKLISGPTMGEVLSDLAGMVMHTALAAAVAAFVATMLALPVFELLLEAAAR